MSDELLIAHIFTALLGGICIGLTVACYVLVRDNLRLSEEVGNLKLEKKRMVSDFISYGNPSAVHMADSALRTPCIGTLTSNVEYLNSNPYAD
jgi:MFS superfamily sulfate permease-like transporter